jgi:predicted ATPase
MALPGARLLQLDRGGLNETSFRETAHFRLYREFFMDPEGTVQAMIED